MIIFLDITNSRTRVGFIGARSAVWREAPSRDAAVRVLTAAKKARLVPASGAKCIVVAIGKVVTAGATARDVSWSGVRAAIATANALAFAWGVPATTATVTGDESDAETATLVRIATKRAKKGGRAHATYNGEPTITKAKS